MHTSLETLCKALDALATAVNTGWSSNQSFLETWGWNCPGLTKLDTAALATKLADDIRQANPEHLDEPLASLIADFPRRLQALQVNTVPQFWGGNNGPAVAAYSTTIDTLRQLLTPLIGWDMFPDPKALPAPVARRLRSVQAELDRIVPDKERLESQVRLIKDAHDAALELPVDMQLLQEAKGRVSQLAHESNQAAMEIKAAAAETKTQFDAALWAANEAKKLVAQCEEAYRITTTKGLAGAFDQRAASLGRSTVLWVLGLIVALAAGAFIGSLRLQELSHVLDAGQPKWNVVALHLVLSALSIGAPVWFAWLATKQIGQRFRLAEDYAFKASVAKAYEGYRREAARIDSAFEARLFASALSRLEEAPLRLVEAATHGSPWHELLESEGFRKALSVVPELKESFVTVAAKVIARAPQKGMAADSEA